MTALALLLTVLVGFSIVAQGSTNAYLLRTHNLWLLLTLGNILCLVSTVVMYLLTRAPGSFWEELARVPAIAVVPAVCGLVITAGMPKAIGIIGVFSALTLAIAVQLLVSLLSDHYIAHMPLSAWRLVGAALVFVGGVFVLRG